MRQMESGDSDTKNSVTERLVSRAATILQLSVITRDQAGGACAPCQAGAVEMLAQREKCGELGLIIHLPDALIR